MKRLPILLFMAVLVPALLPAQSLIGHDPGLNLYDEFGVISAAFPGGGPPLPPFSGTGLLVPSPPPLGGATIDNTTGILYATDGFTIEAINHPAYPPLAIAPPAFAAPPIIGPVTGMAIDPVGAPGGVLYLVGGLSLIAVSPVPGTPVIIPLWGLAGIPGNVITGLEWDPWTSTLWGVDPFGNVHQLPVGASGPPLFTLPPPFPLNNATSLTFDKSFGPVLATPMYVGIPGLAIEYTGLASFPPFPGLALPLPSLNLGLTFHALPALVPGASTCIPGTAPPTVSFNSPAWSGNAGFTVTLGGVVAGSPVALLVDVVGNSLVPAGLPLGAGGLLYLDPFFSPSLLFIPLGPAPAGGLVLPVSLAGFPPGPFFYSQFVVGCAGPPFIALSDGIQFFVSLP